MVNLIKNKGESAYTILDMWIENSADMKKNI